MGRLIACVDCGGLKRAASERCPHCRRVSTGSWVKGAVVGLGTLAACGQSISPALTPGDAGDSGPDGAIYSTGLDAYGAPPFFDAGQPDSGMPDAGDSD